MCGLAGAIELDHPLGTRWSPLLDRMGRAIAHRGPDDSGTWWDDEVGVGLAHARLAVLDLSAAGHQPMVSRDARWVLAFNGEIYNYVALRQRLGQEGVAFRGHSDTEVLLEAIARWGLLPTLRSCNGMFAIAVWDVVERTLSLARDRLGEKPLLYAHASGTLVFGSELPALRQHPVVGSALDPQGLSLYLRHGFVPAPHSIIAGVRKLPAGSVLRARVGDRRPPQIEPYWSLPDVAQRGAAEPVQACDADLIDEADGLLRDSVRIRCESDVPLGAFLSGGVDSSTVVALMAATSERPIQTYTVAVGDSLDEAHHARAVARHLGTAHCEIPLDPKDALDLAPAIAQVYDEPFGDPSAIPTVLMCRLARKHVTVCLTGDGGDEVLAGYNRYRMASAWNRLDRLPRPARRSLRRALLAVAPDRWDRLAAVSATLAGQRRTPPALGVKLHKLAATLDAADAYEAYQRLAWQWDPSSILLDPAGPTPNGGPPGALPDSVLARMLLTDQSTTLPDDMLVKVDRASMSVGLECRVPLLDYRFLEWSWRLPSTAMVRDGRGKWLLRQVLDRYVPSHLVDRPKVGFDPPLDRWLRGPLREWAHDLLAPDRLRRQGLIDPHPVQIALAEHESGRRNHDYLLWTVLALESWLDSPRGGKR